MSVTSDLETWPSVHRSLNFSYMLKHGLWSFVKKSDSLPFQFFKIMIVRSYLTSCVLFNISTSLLKLFSVSCDTRYTCFKICTPWHTGVQSPKSNGTISTMSLSETVCKNVLHHSGILTVLWKTGIQTFSDKAEKEFYLAGLAQRSSSFVMSELQR